MTVQEALDCLGTVSRAGAALEEASAALEYINEASATMVVEFLRLRCEVGRLKEENEALKGEK